MAESYILRIYRRGDESADKSKLSYPVVGMLVDLETDKNFPFHSMEELWRLIADNSLAESQVQWRDDETNNEI